MPREMTDRSKASAMAENNWMIEIRSILRIQSLDTPDVYRSDRDN